MDSLQTVIQTKTETETEGPFKMTPEIAEFCGLRRRGQLTEAAEARREAVLKDLDLMGLVKHGEVPCKALESAAARESFHASPANPWAGGDDLHNKVSKNQKVLRSRLVGGRIARIL